MNFAQNLKYLLKRHQIDVQTLAEKTGIGAPLIYKMAGGKVASPSAYNILAIANYFGLTAEELITQDLTHATWDPSHVIASPTVPLIAWEDAAMWGGDTNVIALGRVPSFKDSPIGKNAFAIMIDSDIYAPKFPENTIFVVDPDAPLKHKHYVIVASESKRTVALKQLLMDESDLYLKSVTVEVSPDAPPIKQTDDDRIVGKVVFAKINL